MYSELVHCYTVTENKLGVLFQLLLLLPLVDLGRACSSVSPKLFKHISKTNRLYSFERETTPPSPVHRTPYPVPLKTTVIANGH